MQYDLFEIEDSYKDNYSGTRQCKRYKKHKPDTTDYFYLKRRTVDKHNNITEWRGNVCKTCHKRANRTVFSLMKTETAPDDNVCDCCGRDDQKLKLDHDHETKEFRGWLCDNCNTGIGRLGDDLEGVMKAVAYLERVQNEQH